jgi:thiol-disulfide isomerase/thioredoxin
VANARSLPIIEPEPVLVEFWATWCPPWRSTLKWLSELKAKYEDRLAVVALAVESPEGGVRSTVSGVGSGYASARRLPIFSRFSRRHYGSPNPVLVRQDGKERRRKSFTEPRLICMSKSARCFQIL